MACAHTANKLKLLDAAHLDPALTPLDFRVLYHIASAMDRQGGLLRRKHDEIAVALGVTRRGVQQCIKRLAQQGFVSVAVSKGSGHTNAYSLPTANAHLYARLVNGEMRTERHLNANTETTKRAPPFAPLLTPSISHSNSLKSAARGKMDLEEKEGFLVTCESPDGEAWRRYWRDTGQIEPFRSGRTGCYAKRLPSLRPPSLSQEVAA
jgi:DNA-binding MarR family transcriptional regulator